MKAQRRLSPAATLLSVGAALLLLFLRRPDALLHPQFWAEDAMFLVDAMTYGFAPRLPYSGYLHLLPRASASVAVLAPALQWPLILNLIAFVFTAAVFLRWTSRRIDVPGRLWLPPALALVPHTGEVFINVTNLQWITAFALLAVLVSRPPQSAREFTSDALWVVVAGLSGPFCLILLPVLAMNLWTHRSGLARGLQLLWLAVSGLQAWVLLHAPGAGANHEPVQAFNGLAVLARRWVGQVLVGRLPIPPALVLLASAALLTWLAIHLRRHARLDAIEPKLILAGLLLLAAAAYKARFDQWSYDDFENGDRYFFIPRVLLVWCVVLLVARGAVSRWVGGGLLAALLIFNLPYLRVPAAIDHGWPDYARKIDAGQPVVVPILPEGTTAPFPGRRR